MRAASLGWAFVSAWLFAFGTTWQHHGAERIDLAGISMPRRVLAFLCDPWWLGGTTVDFGAYVCEVLALRSGPLVAVQAILATGLVLALFLSARRSGLRHRGRDWAAAFTLAAAAVGFVALARDAPADVSSSALRWWVAAAATGVVVLGAATVTRHRDGASRSMALGAATGATYGLTAALTKTTVNAWHRGVIALLRSPWPWSLAAGSFVGLVLGQRAYRAGALRTSLPALQVTQRVVGVTLGIVLLGEQLDLRGARRLVVAAAALGGVVAVAVLSRTEGDGTP